MAPEQANTVVNLPDGGMYVAPPAPPPPRSLKGTHFENLAEVVEESTLTSIASDLIEKVEEDIRTRSDWEKQGERALKLMGVGPESDPDDAESETASTANHTLLLKAMVRFQSRALAEMLPAGKYVTAIPIDTWSQLDDPSQREMVRRDATAAARRAERFYQDYLENRLPTYEEEADMSLFNIGLFGSSFKKIYSTPGAPNPVAIDHVPTEDLIIAYNATSLVSSRVTHRIPMPASELMRNMDSGFYRIVDVGVGTSLSTEQSAITIARDAIQGITTGVFAERDTHPIYEVCCDLVLEDDRHPRGLLRPYVVSIHRDTSKVLSLRRNWEQEDQFERRIEAFSGYKFHPGRSIIYGMGLGDILANAVESLRKGLREGLESAHFQNHPFGFKKSNFTIRNTSSKIVSGELIDVDTPAERIQDAVMVGLFQGPSPGLIQLMEMMSQDGNELGGVATTDFVEMMKSETPVGTALAALEESSHFQNAVQRRLYRGFSKELALLHKNMQRMIGQKGAEFAGGQMLKPGDLLRCTIHPSMRPGQSSRQRRILEAQAALQAAQGTPDQSNIRACLLRYYDAAGIENPEDLIKQPQDAQPSDPITEMNRALQQEPLKAGVTQNHEAHMAAHVASLEMISGSSVTADKGQQAVALLSAHIVEHFALNVAVQIASQIGIPMEMLEQGIPPEIEGQVVPLIADAMMKIRDATAEMSESDIRLAIEEMKNEGKKAIEQMRLEAKSVADGLQHSAAMADVEAKIRTNTDDNITAVKLERIRGEEQRETACAKEACGAEGEGDGGGRARSPNVEVSTGAGARAPTNSPEPSRGL